MGYFAILVLVVFTTMFINGMLAFDYFQFKKEKRELQERIEAIKAELSKEF